MNAAISSDPTPEPMAAPLRVGVLMSVYAHDTAADFERALGSMLRQQLRPGVEMRIYLGVDGPIAQGVEQVIAHHQSHLHRVVRSIKNVGLAVTLNALIATRQDESFYFRMDADDVSQPQRLQTQIDHMQAHPSVDILGTDIVEIDTVSGERREVSFLDRPEHLRRFICFRPPVAHPTVCFRRSVFDRAGPYPLKHGNEDIAMWFRCAALGMRFDNVHQPLLEFSVSSTFWRRRSWSKAWGEFTSYWRGILQLWGVHWRLVFPVIRLLIRLSPTPVSRFVYRWRASALS